MHTPRTRSQLATQRSTPPTQIHRDRHPQGSSQLNHPSASVHSRSQIGGDCRQQNSQVESISQREAARSRAATVKLVDRRWFPSNATAMGDFEGSSGCRVAIEVNDSNSAALQDPRVLNPMSNWANLVSSQLHSSPEWPTLQASLEATLVQKRSRYQPAAPRTPLRLYTSPQHLTAGVSVAARSSFGTPFIPEPGPSFLSDDKMQQCPESLPEDDGEQDQVAELDWANLRSDLEVGQVGLNHSFLNASSTRISPLILSSPSPPSNSAITHSEVAEFPGHDLVRCKPRHGRTMVIVERGGTTLTLERDDEVIVCNDLLQDEGELDSSLFAYHSDQYLKYMTTTTQLVHLRFVFAAHQLPRGVEFTNLTGPLRAHNLVDTYMIPHESNRVHEDHDVVLGLSGARSRVGPAVQEFLCSIAPKQGVFNLWRICLLVPRSVIHLLLHMKLGLPPQEESSRVLDSSIPCLRRAQGRSYGPVPGSTHEYLFSLESCCLDTIKAAIEYVARVLASSDVSQESCEGYYRGARRSIIPKEVRGCWEQREGVTQMHTRVPAGYVLRPEIRSCLKVMHTRRYHLQFILTAEQAALLSGEHGTFVRQLCGSKFVIVCISDQIIPDKDEVRVCDVGGDELDAITGAVVAIVCWIVEMTLGDWSVGFYIPERMACKLRTYQLRGDWKDQGFQHDVYGLFDVERLARLNVTQLEPAEEEYILKIRSDSQAEGLRFAVAAAMIAMYE
ncbi:hypothetical protein EDD11_008049 [Mortierella claussenii]|nr:hypothetical protein EDD11_008049 [Mortierella claussenii]